jgi:hypothetical protein
VDPAKVTSLTNLVQELERMKKSTWEERKKASVQTKANRMAALRSLIALFMPLTHVRY